MADTGGALPALEGVLETLGPTAALDDPAVLDALPANYLESRREHCTLARRCKAEAAIHGDAVLLGAAAREALDAAGSLDRTLELLYARVPTPHPRGARPRRPPARSQNRLWCRARTSRRR